MRRVLLAVGACALALTLTASTQAAEHHRGGRPVVVRPYYRDHGVRFTGGYYYRGVDHPHWDRRVWDPVYRRYNYYDPGLRCYYYWYPAGQCYYPVTYVCP